MTHTPTPLPEQRDLIGGSFAHPGEKLEHSIYDSNTGERLSLQYQSTDAAVMRAIDTAAEAHRAGTLGRRSLEERAVWLERIATAVEPIVKAIAHVDAITTGVIIGDTTKMAELVPHVFRMAAAELRDGWMEESLPGKFGPVDIVKKPLGPAALIVPWNSPAPIGAHKIASALAAGCPAIVKPSEWAPHSLNLLMEAIHNVGLPAGTLQMVHGAAHVGGMLVTDPRIRAVSFTGGLQAGKNVGRVCGEALKPAQLELGGNNPLVVLEDAHIEATAQAIVSAMSTLNGQWCRALGRVFVHASLKDKLLDATEQALSEVQLGHSLNPESQMGPLVHAGHLQHLQARSVQLASLGATVHATTQLPNLDGYFLAPTLFSGLMPSQTEEEIFGPMGCVHTFESDAQAITLANQAPFGLAGYVFGSEERALTLGAKLETGMVKVNGVTVVGLNPKAPRPAWKQSGLGVEGTRASIDFFSGTTVLGIAAQPEEDIL